MSKGRNVSVYLPVEDLTKIEAIKEYYSKHFSLNGYPLGHDLNRSDVLHASIDTLYYKVLCNSDAECIDLENKI